MMYVFCAKDIVIVIVRLDKAVAVDLFFFLHILRSEYKISRSSADTYLRVFAKEESLVGL